MKRRLRILTIEGGVGRLEMVRQMTVSFASQDSIARSVRREAVMFDIPVTEAFPGEPHAAKVEQPVELEFRRLREQVIVDRDAWKVGRGDEIAELPVFPAPIGHPRFKIGGPAAFHRGEKSARVSDKQHDADVEIVGRHKQPDPLDSFRRVDDNAFSGTGEGEIESLAGGFLLDVVKDLAPRQTSRGADCARLPKTVVPGPMILADECGFRIAAEDISGPRRPALRGGQNKDRCLLPGYWGRIRTFGGRPSRCGGSQELAQQS